MQRLVLFSDVLLAAACGEPVSTELTNVAISAMCAENRHKFLLWQESGAPRDGVDAYRVVFVRDGTRYTIDHLVGGFEIWERPDGTSSQDAISYYWDHDTPGCVDHGRYREPDGTTHEDSDVVQQRFKKALEAVVAQVGD